MYSKEEMKKHLQEDPEAFAKILQEAISDSWRSAWLLNHCIEKNDVRLQNHIESIADSIEGKEDGHRRELMKILLKMEFDNELEGKIFNLAVNTWEQIRQQPSVRQVAFRLIVKIAKKHPELTHEIRFLTKPHYLEPLSKGIKHSILNMIAEMDKLSLNTEKST